MNKIIIESLGWDIMLKMVKYEDDLLFAITYCTFLHIHLKEGSDEVIHVKPGFQCCMLWTSFKIRSEIVPDHHKDIRNKVAPTGEFVTLCLMFYNMFSFRIQYLYVYYYFTGQ